MTKDMPVGRRVAYWRGRRKMSQQVFADRIGKSKSWVDKVERGIRRLDSIVVIGAVAGALDIDADVLLDRGTADAVAAESGMPPVGVEAIRAALEQHPPTSEIRTWSELRASVNRAWSECLRPWSETRAHVLSALIGDARAATVQRRGRREEAAQLLGEVYQLVSRSLRGLGQGHLAWLAADRAVAVSCDAQDDLLFASSIAQVAAALTTLGRPRSALEMSVAAAGRVASVNRAGVTTGALSVYGYLLLQAAMAAAKLGDSTTAEKLVSAAESPAKRLGREERLYATTFGPVALLLHRVAVDVELGEMARAVATNQQFLANLASVLPEGRAVHLLNVARAHGQLGHVAEATRALVEADHLAPAEVSHHPATPGLVADILRLRRTGGEVLPAALAGLADRVGLGSVRIDRTASM